MEDDRVGKLDIARIAIGLDTDAGRYGSDGTNGCAQRQGRRVADVGEVTEAGHRVSKWLLVGFNQGEGECRMCRFVGSLDD